MFRAVLLTLWGMTVTSTAAAAVDTAALWDFNNPAVSEQRFRDALKNAHGDDALIIQTQVARTYMLRKDFAKARDVLRSIEPELAGAGPEARTRYWLELGRSYASHQHSPEAQSPESKRLARAAFSQALMIAKKSRLDSLAIDATHMFVFVDTSPADQLKWNKNALELIADSDQPDAKRWEASISSNTGEALFELGRYDDAMSYFRRSLELRKQSGNSQAARDAHWHMARVLRMQQQYDDALGIQLRLERESEIANQPRDYIFEELQLLYEAKGEKERAGQYAERAKALLR